MKYFLNYNLGKKKKIEKRLLINQTKLKTADSI